MSLFAAWLLLLSGLFLVGALVVWVLAPLHAGGALAATDDARLLLRTAPSGRGTWPACATWMPTWHRDAGAQTHAAVREELLSGGSRILAAIDESLERVVGDRRDALERLEAAVAERHGLPQATRQRPTPLLTTCPTCRRVTATEDRFCRHCGHDLSKGKLG